MVPSTQKKLSGCVKHYSTAKHRSPGFTLSTSTEDTGDKDDKMEEEQHEGSPLRDEERRIAHEVNRYLNMYATPLDKIGLRPPGVTQAGLNWCLKHQDIIMNCIGAIVIDTIKCHHSNGDAKLWGSAILELA